ncbi:hypothetical protein HAX54_047231 [Datura stramonium]|uniref:RNase H type-1 domain-containing protein n=1 Tax=Datura stramonium TaxID=4076 RepID=A0ABS8SSA8_DATST|nr:hypothetical protein [Datura stramonium]
MGFADVATIMEKSKTAGNDAFYVRIKDADVVGTKGRRLSVATNMIAKAISIKEGLEICIPRQFYPAIVETDSLAMVNIINGIWKIPWFVTMEVNTIKRSMERVL